MKSVKNIILLGLTILIAVACEDGIDPISHVPKGVDELAPVITINYPQEGDLVQDSLEIAPVVFKLTALDDVEMKEVIVELDGQEIERYTAFTDYMIVKKDVHYPTLEVGAHTLSVTATDMTDKTATSTVNFLRVTDLGMVGPLPDESYYMPFDGENIDRFIYRADMVSVFGTPVFNDNGKMNEAYEGAADSYLTVPVNGLTSDEFSAAFWYKVNATPDRSGILVIGAPDQGKPADAQNNRQFGFRLFREGNAEKQRIKLNVGNGEGDAWNDGGEIDVNDEWVHIAFTISNTSSIVYINGEAVNQNDITGVSWDNCEVMSIMAGDPYFNEWGHKSDNSLMDELRLFNKALTAGEISGLMADIPDVLDSETYYMAFDGDYLPEMAATTTGMPAYVTDGYSREAYQGAADSYLTVPTLGFLSSEVSATFWYKVNATPDRSGILVVGAPDTGKPADAQNNRNFGFRLFREGNAEKQRIKLNVGNGVSDAWNDGGEIDVDGQWVHIAFTISATNSVVYINGVAVNTNDITGVSWENCEILSVMSGDPYFNEWGHKYDASIMDELRFYKKALSADEVRATMK
ncbi:LamG domain-containing protein [Carboxylicivirga sp. M1479]|uniref:LamG domain-containing protein n=1 Tax=Carboxylicivirga sp. M1479 TaxID=2594476 RepID=UPI0011787124|nr:LamG domain-containing protein [Carboxylicivirga sp. M1479]TRX72568.1 LamG domain-containing protein [Carboxylicivirga sp. M1479]